MKFVLGTKEYMTQIFDEEGRAHPVTAIKAGPVTVLQVKTQEKDGYKAIQVGFGTRNEKRVSKAQKGHYGDKGAFSHVLEFRTENDETEYSVGDVIDVSLFADGDEVIVSGTSKGKGFQGVVKRHGFSGGRRTHGQKHSEREPGSIGSTGPQKVLKGLRMAGRMGGSRVTVKNMEVVKVDPEKGILFLRGAVPGRKGSLVEVRSLAK